MPKDQTPAPAAPGDTVEALAEHPGWLRLRRLGHDAYLPAAGVVAITHGGFGTDIVSHGGYLMPAGTLPADAILAAVRQAGATPLPVPDNDSAPRQTAEALAAALAERRRTLTEALQRQGSTPRPEALRHALGALRDRAIALAEATTHPRDWMLLLADAATEAAQQTGLDGHGEAAELFTALASTLAGEARRLRTEEPPV